MDPNKDLTILAIGGGTPERLAALVSGSVDATVITSPAEYAAEKQGLRVIMSARELGELVRIPITGIGATQKKMEKDPDEIVRLLRALRLATLYLLQNPEYRRDVFKESCASMPPPCLSCVHELLELSAAVEPFDQRRAGSFERFELL